MTVNKLGFLIPSKKSLRAIDVLLCTTNLSPLLSLLKDGHYVLGPKKKKNPVTELLDMLISIKWYPSLSLWLIFFPEREIPDGRVNVSIIIPSIMLCPSNSLVLPLLLFCSYMIFPPVLSSSLLQPPSLFQNFLYHFAPLPPLPHLSPFLMNLIAKKEISPSFFFSYTRPIPCSRMNSRLSLIEKPPLQKQQQQQQLVWLRSLEIVSPLAQACLQKLELQRSRVIQPVPVFPSKMGPSVNQAVEYMHGIPQRARLQL